MSGSGAVPPQGQAPQDLQLMRFVAAAGWLTIFAKNAVFHYYYGDGR
jgi:hypothetical protein